MRIIKNLVGPIPVLCALPLALVLLMASTPRSFAATGTWNNTGGGNWSLSGNWTGSIPTAPGDIANVTANLTAARFVTLDVNATVGVLNIGDSGTSYFAYLLFGSGTSTLTFNNNATGAQLNKPTAANNAGDNISTFITLADNLTVNIAATAAAGGLTVGGNIGESGGARSLTKTGAGTLTLSGANTYSGGTTLSAGTLQLGHASAIGTGPLTISGGTLNSSAPNDLVNSQNNAQNWNGNFAFAGTYNLNLGTGAVAMNASRTVTVTNNTLTVGGVISDGGSGFGLTKLGAGTLALSGANTYSGATTINVGKLVGVVGGSSGSSAVTVAATAGNTATLGVSVTDITKQWTCSSLVVNNAGTSSTLDFNFGYATTPSTSLAPLNVTGSATFTTAPTVTVEGGANLAVTTGDGYPLMTWGSGSPSLTGVTLKLPSHIIGTLSIVGSTLYLQITANTEPLKWLTSTSGTWDTTTSNWKDSPGTTTTYNENTIPGDPVIFDETYISANTAVTLSTTVNPGSITVNNPARTYTISGAGVIAGSTSLTKSGAATFTLSGAAHTYTGDTIINNGTLQLSRPGNVASSRMITVNSGGTLLLNSASSTWAPGNNNISLNGGTLAMTAASGTGQYITAVGAANVPTTSSFITVSAGSVGAPNATSLFLDNGLTGSGTVTISSSTVNVGVGLRTFSTSFSGTLIVNGTASTAGSSGSGLTVGNSPGQPNLANADLQINGTMEMGTVGFGWANGPVSGMTLAIGALNGTGVVIANMGTASSTRGLSLGNNNANGTFSGVIANGALNTMSLVKNGAGTQTLSGTNTYTGATTISGGTLTIGGAGQLGSGAYAGLVTNNGVFNYNSTASQVLSGDMTGTGSVTVNAGKLYLNGIVSPTIPLTVGAGATLGGKGTNGAVSVAVGGGIEGGQAGAGTLTMSNLTYSGTGTLTVSPAANYVPVIVTNQLAVNGTVTINVANSPALGATYHLLAYMNSTGAGGFVLPALRAPYTLATNTITGTNYVDLVVGPTALYPIWTGAYSSEWSVNNINSPKNWNLNTGGGTDFMPADNVVFDDSASSTSVNISAANVAPASTTFSNASSSYTLAGAYGINGGTLTKVNAGAVAFTGSGGLTLSGTTVNGGSLGMGNSVANSLGVVTVNGGTLLVDSTNTASSVTIGAGGSVQVGNNDANGSLAVNITNNGALSFNRTDAATYANAISGTGTLTKNGSGTLTLTASSTHTGGTTVSAGTLQIGAGAAAGSLAGPIVNNATVNFYRSDGSTVSNLLSGGGTMNFLGTGVDLQSYYSLSNDNAGFTGTINVTNARINALSATSSTNWLGNPSMINISSGGGIGAGFFIANQVFNQPIRIAGQGWLESASRLGAVRLEGGARWTGPITLTANARIGVNGAATGTISGAVDGGYELELWGNNAGGSITNAATTNLTAATRITGPVNIIAAGTNAFSLGSLTMSNATLKVMGYNFAFSNLTGNSSSPVIQNGHASTASTLTIGADGTSTLYGGTLINGSTAALGLTKVGAGTLTLTNVNTYTGSTTVSNGTLALMGSGSLASATIAVASGAFFDVSGRPNGAFTLASGKTLSGNGTVNGSITNASGSTVSAGSSPGALTITNALVFNSGSTNVTDIDTSGSPVNDQINSASVAFNGGHLAVNYSGPALTGGESFQIFNATTYSGAGFASYTALGGNLNWWFNSANGALLVNRAPTASNFDLGVAVGGTTTATVIGKYAAATDLDGNGVSITTVSAPANGTNLIVGGTDILYTSTNGAASDSFTYTVSDGRGGTATATVTVTTYSPEGFNRLSPPSVIGSGTVVLNYLGIPGYNYALDWATNLTPPINWMPVITNPAAGNGSLTFTNTSSEPVNFFRTRQVP